jgi:hypothetical protein
VHGLCIYGPQARVLFWTLDYNPDTQTFAHELSEMFFGREASLSCTVPGLCSILGDSVCSHLMLELHAPWQWDMDA